MFEVSWWWWRQINIGRTDQQDEIKAWQMEEEKALEN
jgi:hypothetical protein